MYTKDILKTFSELNIKQEIKDATEKMGFSEPTPIQAEVIPSILEGRDCLAQAPTGTGKTCAFGVPLVNMVDTKNPSVQAVVLCPTRELAMQTEKEIKKLAIFLPSVRVLAVYGGQPIERQLAGLRRKPQIIVGTPGRIIDHLRRRTLKLQGAKTVVLDEADEMLDMGFRDDIKSILSEMPDGKQSMLFSATMAPEILDISRRFQTNPVMVKTTISGEDMPPITQYFVKLKESTKYDALLRIIREEDYKFVLVFTNTKRKADELDGNLQSDFFLSAALHGDLRQKVRDAVMRSFREKQINILVATDVAARGIDVENIEAIFNYDVPLDEEYYIHRLGRTARANKTGVAYSFVTARDINKLNFYEKLTGSPIQELKLAGLSEDKLSKSKRKESTGKKFFLNVGAKDDLNENKIAKFIESKSVVTVEDIESVKVLDIYSFVTVRKEIADELLTLNGERFANRRLAVEPAEELSGRGKERPRSSQGRGSKGDSKSSSSGSKKSRYQSEDKKSRYASEDKKSRYASEDKKPRYQSEDKKSKSGDGQRKDYRPKSNDDRKGARYRINEYGTKVAIKDGDIKSGRSERPSSYKPKMQTSDKPRIKDGYKPRNEGNKFETRNSGATNKPKQDGYKPRGEGKTAEARKSEKGKSGGADYRKFRSGASKKKSPTVTFGDNRPKRK